MADQSFSFLPRILLARGGPWPLGFGGSRPPENVGSPPIDYDLSGGRLPWAAPGLASSYWLPSSVLEGSSERMAAAAAALYGAARPVALVVDFPRRGEPNMAVVARAAALGAATSGNGAIRPMLGLRAAHLVGGRQHLALLTALRRLAEEWDVGFARPDGVV